MYFKFQTLLKNYYFYICEHDFSIFWEEINFRKREKVKLRLSKDFSESKYGIHFSLHKCLLDFQLVKRVLHA